MAGSNEELRAQLPELPEPTMRELNPYLNAPHDPYEGATHLRWFTADQMRDYALASLAGREEGREAVYPMQPLALDSQGVLRFRKNTLVRHLLDNGGLTMNDLALVDCPQEEREQFAQLIGYSLYGFGTLSYVSDATYERAAASAPEDDHPALAPAQEPAGGGEGLELIAAAKAVVTWYAKRDKAGNRDDLLDPADQEPRLARLMRALDATPTPQAAGAAPEGLPEFEFEVWQGGAWQAGGTAQTLDDAIREASHYEMMYGQDGPVEVKLYERRAIPQPGAQEQSA